MSVSKPSGGHLFPIVRFSFIVLVVSCSDGSGYMKCSAAQTAVIWCYYAAVGMLCSCIYISLPLFSPPLPYRKFVLGAALVIGSTILYTNPTSMCLVSKVSKDTLPLVVVKQTGRTGAHLLDSNSPPTLPKWWLYKHNGFKYTILLLYKHLSLYKAQRWFLQK